MKIPQKTQKLKPTHKTKFIKNGGSIYRMTNARIKLPPNLQNLPRTHLERLIYEAHLGDDDSMIATKYLIEHQTQYDIAAEFGMSRQSIGKRVKRIISTLSEIKPIYRNTTNFCGRNISCA